MEQIYTSFLVVDSLYQIRQGNVATKQDATLLTMVYEEDIEPLKKAVSIAMEKGYYVYAWRLRTEENSLSWVLGEMTAEQEMDRNGKPCVHIKIWNIKSLETWIQNIQIETGKFKEYLYLLQGILLDYNPAKDHLLIYSVGMKDNKWFEGSLEQWFVREDMLEQDRRTLSQLFSSHMHSFEYILPLTGLTEEPKSLSYRLVVRALSTAGGQRMYAGCFLPTDERVSKQEQYNLSDAKDVLMDVLNKKAITDYAKKLFLHEQTRQAWLCILDIDNFKQINDTYGHMSGDEVLIEVAEIIKRTLLNRGVVGRIGGDELMIVIDESESYEMTRGILRNIRSNIEWAFKGRFGTLLVTCSIGVACCPDYAKDYDTLFTIADKMLYRAKGKGKNRYIIYTPEIHGNVLEQNTEAVQPVASSAPNKSKQEFVLSLSERLLHQHNITYNEVLSSIGQVFSLSEVHVFYGNPAKEQFFWSIQPMEQPPAIEFVREDGFENLYREGGLAVIDNVSFLEAIYPKTHRYMSDRHALCALIYRMNMAPEEGYVVLLNNNKLARKWADNDKIYLQVISRYIELALTMETN